MLIPRHPSRPAAAALTTTARAAVPILRAALLLLLSLALAATPAAAQADERLPGARSPLLAAALAVNVPGAGHFYAGERKEALVLATVVTAGFALFLSGTPGTDDCHLPTCDPGWAQRRVEVGGGIVLGAYVFSLVDAPLAALRRNRARGAPAPHRATANLITAGGGDPGIQIRLPIGR